jgi:UTP--glucose-1-phosphate uridylyltransferase
MINIRKAVFPVAGLGTRFLPASKAIPKELATVVDTPVLQYVVAEARAAGIEQFIFVSSIGKNALEDHFDRNVQIEAALAAKGRQDLVQSVKDASLGDGEMIIVRQHAALGLGHAVWCARHAVGDEPFAVLLPDELLMSDPPCLAAMVDAYQSLNETCEDLAVIATAEIPRALTRKYGILDPAAPEDANRLTLARGVVEKPEPAAAPSIMSLIGRYILPSKIFALLENQPRGAGGEIQLTDAIDALIADGLVFGHRFVGNRYDCGVADGFVRANVAYALNRADIRKTLIADLRAMLDAAESND